MAMVMTTTGAQAGLPSVQPKRTLGVWLTNSPSPLYYDRTTLLKAMDELQQAGFTALYPNVWSRGTTFHRSRFAPVEPALRKAGLNLDPICTISKEGRFFSLVILLAGGAGASCPRT